MRIHTLILCSLLVLVPLSFSQDSARPKKILTPEQQAYQQRVKGFFAQRERLQAQPQIVFDAEMAREKAGDCPEAGSTYEFNLCFGKAVESTDKNLKSFEDAIRNLLSLKLPEFNRETSRIGPAGPVLTEEQLTTEFEHMEKVWHSYLDLASTAAFHQYGGGTGGPSAEMQFHIRIVRSHMRELDALYFMLLHK